MTGSAQTCTVKKSRDMKNHHMDSTAWDKDFMGKEAALAEKARGPKKRLVTLVIDVADRDVVNDEAILKDGTCVGYVSSGGYAHHVRKSVAMGYVSADLVRDGMALEVEINGAAYPASIVAQPLYDPNGGRMRG